MLNAVIDQSVYIHRLILALGIVNVLAILAVFFSCRSFVRMSNFFSGKDTLRNKLFNGFYKYHTYYWIIFWVSVFLHVITALAHTGLQ